MFLTLEILDKYNACDKGKEWFAHFFPNGGELKEVLSHRFITPEILHWGYTHLTTTAEEKEIYWKKLNIECDNVSTIYHSDNIKHSEWVSHSSNITDSTHIYSSNNVATSHNILSSKDVSNSHQIFGSEFVYSSKQIIHSKNITSSHNIVSADYVVNSHSIMNSAAVTNSAFVDGWLPGRTKQIKDCRFIMECVNLKHSLFCYKISDGEYMIFNNQMEKEDYELIVKQLDVMLKDYKAELVKHNHWPANTIPLHSPAIQVNKMKQYSKLPSSFWRWVKTLPGYDPSVLYAITYNKELI